MAFSLQLLWYLWARRSCKFFKDAHLEFCFRYGTYLYSIDVIKTPGDIFVVLLAIMSGAYHLGMATPHLTVMLTARVAGNS